MNTSFCRNTDKTWTTSFCSNMGKGAQRGGGNEPPVSPEIWTKHEPLFFSGKWMKQKLSFLQHRGTEHVKLPSLLHQSLVFVGTLTKHGKLPILWHQLLLQDQWQNCSFCHTHHLCLHEYLSTNMLSKPWFIAQTSHQFLQSHEHPQNNPACYSIIINHLFLQNLMCLICKVWDYFF